MVGGTADQARRTQPGARGASGVPASLMWLLADLHGFLVVERLVRPLLLVPLDPATNRSFGFGEVRAATLTHWGHNASGNLMDAQRQSDVHVSSPKWPLSEPRLGS